MQAYQGWGIPRPHLRRRKTLGPTRATPRSAGRRPSATIPTTATTERSFNSCILDRPPLQTKSKSESFRNVFNSLLCLRYHKTVWDSILTIWDSILTMWDSVLAIWESILTIWESIRNFFNSMLNHGRSASRWSHWLNAQLHVNQITLFWLHTVLRTWHCHS